MANTSMSAPSLVESSDSRPSSRHSNPSLPPPPLPHSHDGTFRLPIPPPINFNGHSVTSRSAHSASPLHSPFPHLRGDPGPSTASYRSASPATPAWPDVSLGFNGHGHGGGAQAGTSRLFSGDGRSMAPPLSCGSAGGKGKGRLLVDGMVADEVRQLQTHLQEIVELSKFYADDAKPAPSDVLLRIGALSTIIHRQLLALQPQIHPLLDPTFTPAPTPPERKPTAAERDMEMIRVRRDALIAKAAAQNALATATAPAPTPTSPEKDKDNDKDQDASVSIRSDVTADHALRNWMPLQRWAGKCHSCGTAETVHWRTGPDGPGSLCDICGSHYAKLTRNGPMISPSEIGSGHSTPMVMSYSNPYPQPGQTHVPQRL